MGKNCCEVPCWSGVWFEIEGLGYLEIYDGDQRFHRPPEGWELHTIHYNILNSSQIFRYIPRVGAESLVSQ